jgi:cardiolipin hydrolase
LTDSKIADCLIRAHKAGIEVTVITDKERMRDKYSKVDKLVAQKVPVFYYNSDLNQNPKQKKSKNGLMHHKFIIVDEAILLFGSLNLTKAGQNENIENITVTTKAKMVTDYLDEFKRLLLLSTKINL